MQNEDDDGREFSNSHEMFCEDNDNYFDDNESSDDKNFIKMLNK